MTEKTANKKRRETYVIDPVAFFAALFGAPLVVAVVGFWIGGIPIAAVVFGGPLYLVVGTPVLLWHLARHAPNSWTIAGLAFLSFAVLIAAAGVYSVLLDEDGIIQFLMFFAGFGLVFAPIWGGVFGILYRQFRREIYAKPI
ncbi:MAG: hypothetical protein AAFW87_12830 [Pseudomonadota bacterium]